MNNHNQNLKCCLGCKEIMDVKNFRKANGGRSYQSRCRPCEKIQRKLREQKKKLENPKPKTKRLNPFEKLPLEKRQEILKYWNTMTMARIGRQCNINRFTLSTWKRRSYIKV